MTPRIPEGDRVSEPETVTITVPHQAAKAIGEWSVVHTNPSLVHIIKACKEATAPKPRFVVGGWDNWWQIRDTKHGCDEATFRKGTFTKDDVQAICDKLNEGER